MKQTIKRGVLGALAVVVISCQGYADTLSEGGGMADAQSGIHQLIAKAILHYPSIKQAQNQVDASSFAIETAQGSRLPTIDFDGTYGPERSESPTISSAGESHRNRVRRESSLTLTQSLYDFGANRARINLAKAQSKESQMTQINTREELIYLVISHAIKMQRFRTLLDNARENLKAHRTIAELVRKRVSLKVDSAASSNLIQGRLALAELKVERYQEQSKSAAVELAKYTGEAPGTLAPLPENLLTVQPQYTLQGHPVLRLRKAQVDAAAANQAEARSAFYPQLGLELVASQSDDVSGVDGTSNELGAYLTLQFNLYGGGSDQAAASRQRALFQAANLAYEEEKANIQTSLSVAFSGLKVTQGELKYFASNKREIEKAKEAYGRQYVAGQRTLFDLLNIQSELFNATESYIQASFDEQQKRMDIQFEAGVLEQSVNNSQSR
ncbi:TolC family protein [Magnetococcus sp. PR-3]|uniref:TolC family protein n=1 Tax=Magnetococcus sp. PR-3 TaxID=3120355 RepID=UPI002FCE04C9